MGKPVGRGGYSVVYKGVRKSDRRTVAIKKVEIFDMVAKKRERCLQEVQLLQSLSHPNIIHMVDSFIEDNMLIIVFEWALGGDLKRLLKRQIEMSEFLDEGVIWGHFIQVTGALRFMHEKRIMHRDIKPANVLVTATGLKLGDLGLGRHFSTQTNEAFSKVGTPYYVSPEVVQGAGYDWKSDVWSLGCLLYEMAMLRSPFETEGANLVSVFKKISRADYEPLGGQRTSKPLRTLVTRMLQLDPSIRPEISEVDDVARHVFANQARGLGDVYLAAETVADKLALLGSEVKRFKEKFRPRADLLKQMHPAYFATAAPGVRGSQFKQFVGIFAWLMLLNGKKKASLEMDLDAIDEESEEPVPFKPLTSENAPPESENKVSEKEKEARRKEQCYWKLFDTSPAQNRRIDLAMAIIAEAAKLEVEIDLVVPSRVAEGHGWSVCQLLLGMLEVTLKHLKVRPRAPVLVAQPEDDGIEELPDDNEVIGELVPRNEETGEVSGEEWEGEDGISTSMDMLAEERASFSRLATPSRRSMEHQENGGIASMLHPTVSAEVWKAEAERLKSVLSHVKVTGVGQFGGWGPRLAQLTKTHLSYVEAGPTAATLASNLVKALQADLESVEHREGRINSELQGAAKEYSDAKSLLDSRAKSRQELEERVMERTHMLAELNEAIAQSKAAQDDASATIDSSSVLRHAKVAKQKLKEEIMTLESSVIMAQHALLRIARKQRS